MAAEERQPEEEAHVYDGIVEHNHPLPGWWKWTLYGAIVFAVVYYFDVQVLRIHPSLREEHDARVLAEQKAAAEKALASGAVTSDVLASMAKDPGTVAEGRAIFAGNCVACHRADGGGAIGPNLTDAYWLHGGKPEDLYKVVREGVPSKGMPTWGPQLGDQKSAAVVAFVLTLRGSNVPGGKAPQGVQED